MAENSKTSSDLLCWEEIILEERAFFKLIIFFKNRHFSDLLRNLGLWQTQVQVGWFSLWTGRAFSLQVPVLLHLS